MINASLSDSPLQFPYLPTHTPQIPQINREIENEGKKYKEGQQKGVPVSDDEKLRPYDPNLVCPHCGQRLRHGQIREYRYHIDDEHSPQ